MTTMSLTRPYTWSGATFLEELQRREPRFAATAIYLCVMMLPTLFAGFLDTRSLLGENVWIKPLKFEIALAVYMGTLAWFAGWLPHGMTESRWYRIFSSVIVLCVVLEMVWIAGASAVGIQSHFNTSSPLMVAVYPVMGVLAITLTATTVVYGVQIWRNKMSPLDPDFRLAVSLSLLLTFLLTVLIAGYMAGQPGHAVSVDPEAAERSFLFGWLKSGGDLRIAHFFATHALHFIPLAALASIAWLQVPTRRIAVLGFSGAYVGFVLFAFTQAVQGTPFLAFLP